MCPLKHPPIGETEKALSVAILPKLGTVRSAWRDLQEYEISNIGIGIEAVNEIFKIILQRKFNLPLNKVPSEIWTRLLTVEADCELIDRSTGIPFRNFNSKKLNSILRKRMKKWSINRIKDIELLAELDLSAMAPPLYVSARVLTALANKTLQPDVFMVDGARRLMAGAIQGLPKMLVKIIIFPEEYAVFLGPSIQKQIQKQVNSVSWFPKYQTIDTVNIQGSRSINRMCLINCLLFRDHTVLDFGCSFGQMSIAAAQSGASKVLGIEGMNDTIEVARLIKYCIGLPNLDFLQVNFNSHDFDKQINKVFPEQADYTFFLSVYRTKELTQRNKLFDYILKKTKISCFVEGHADPYIDTNEYYLKLFSDFGVQGKFLGFSEGDLRPLYSLDLSN